MVACNNPKTRKRVFLAHEDRLSFNATALKRILALRAELASLYGYNSWADYRIEVRSLRLAYRTRSMTISADADDGRRANGQDGAHRPSRKTQPSSREREAATTRLQDQSRSSRRWSAPCLGRPSAFDGQRFTGRRHRYDRLLCPYMS